VTQQLTSTGSAVADSATIRATLDLFDAVQLDTQSIPPSRLNLEGRSRTNLFPWRGQFSPELVHILLKHYSPAGATVLDPFAGVGTTLFEAARLQTPSVGTEINPAAVAMAETLMFCPLAPSDRRKILHESREILADALPGNGTLFDASPKPCGKSCEEILVALIRDKSNFPGIRNILTNVLIRLLEQRDGERDIWHAFEHHASIVTRIPHTDIGCRVFICDARRVPVPDSTVDVVLTSPPYINVFNYHQNNRVAMELLGWDLLKVARSEFGANRKNRGNRFLTVVQYCADLGAAFLAMRRSLKPHGLAVMVVGRQSTVRGIQFENGRIAAALANLAGFQLVARHERLFTNMFGEAIYEDILVLRPDASKAGEMNPVGFKFLGQCVLAESLPRASKTEVLQDIKDAIQTAMSVQESPILCEETHAARLASFSLR
jgi:hypothetical protein